MDRITKSYLAEYAATNDYKLEGNETKVFEHFVNYILVEARTEERFDVEAINIGGDGTLGIDGFALILNRQVIDSKSELDDFLKSHKEITAEMVFVQAKTSRGFEVKEFGNFGWAVNDFISEKPRIKWTGAAAEKIALLDLLFKNTHLLKGKPKCHLYYATLATHVPSADMHAKVSETHENINSENLFSSIKIDLLDASAIQARYKKIGQAIEKSFEFPSRVTLPEISGVTESYLGVVDAPTIIRLITNEDDELLPNVFYDNVRDYQGENNVNKEISATLKTADKSAFVVLNNGVTIVAESISTTRERFTIENYQIINGCQTSHVLYQNRDALDANVRLPLKLISSKDQNLTAKLIRSTNRQTEVKEQDLLAFSAFQKTLEEFYKTFTDDKQRLYYERRSKQYSAKPIEKKRIVDKTTQIKAIASFNFDKPNMATRYFGVLFGEFGSSLFRDGHSHLPYYTAAYTLFNLDRLFRKGQIDSKYKKLKYFILMMLRYEMGAAKFPPFESKKVEEVCNRCLSIVNDSAKFQKAVKGVLKKIDSLGLDLSDSELSKSYKLVKDCVQLY